MRIVCEKCSATYTIEDKLIPAKGARIQCRRCKHQQRVEPPRPAQPSVEDELFPEPPPAPPGDDGAQANPFGFDSTPPEDPDPFGLTSQPGPAEARPAAEPAVAAPHS